MVPEQEKVTQLTEFDSRFYVYGEEFRPSVTYVQSVGYPTPAHLQKWKADQGWDEAEAIKDRAAEQGSLIHNSIEELLKHNNVLTEGMNLKVKRSIQAFIDWYREEQPQVIRFEYKIFGARYAGTVDLLCKLKSDGYKDTWLIDYKSGGVYDTGKSQIVAYKKEDPEATRVAILQLGNKTKKRYTFSAVKVEDESYYWAQFEASYAWYKLLRPNDRPPESYPEIFTLQSVTEKAKSIAK